jgi:hypothetical protein
VFGTRRRTRADRSASPAPAERPPTPHSGSFQAISGSLRSYDGLRNGRNCPTKSAEGAKPISPPNAFAWTAPRRPSTSSRPVRRETLQSPEFAVLRFETRPFGVQSFTAACTGDCTSNRHIAVFSDRRLTSNFDKLLSITGELQFTFWGVRGTRSSASRNSSSWISKPHRCTGLEASSSPCFSSGGESMPNAIM